MDFTAKQLCEVIASPYGETFGKSMLETVRDGNVIKVTLEDGSTLSLRDQTEAMILLRRFGWNPMKNVA